MTVIYHYILITIIICDIKTFISLRICICDSDIALCIDNHNNLWHKNSHKSSPYYLYMSQFFYINYSNITSISDFMYTSHKFSPYHLYKSQLCSISLIQVTILLHITYASHNSSPYHLYRSQFFSLSCFKNLHLWHKKLTKMRIFAFLSVVTNANIRICDSDKNAKIRICDIRIFDIRIFAG